MRILDENGNEITDPDLTKGYLVEEYKVKEGAEPIDNVTKFVWADDDWETVQRYRLYTDGDITRQEEAKAAAKREANLNAIAELVKTTTVPSDKLGYIWKCTYIGDVCVVKEYIEDPDSKGTEDNPIEWATGVPLIPNAYYTHDSKKYVYVGEQSVAGDVWDGTDFEAVDW